MTVIDVFKYILRLILHMCAKFENMLQPQILYATMNLLTKRRGEETHEIFRRHS